MKKIIFSLLAVLIFGNINAQKLSRKQYGALLVKKLQLSKKFGDLQAYRSSLYDLIAWEGEQSAYLDTLADFYYANKEWIPFVLLNGERLKRHPEHRDYLYMQAVAWEQLGNLKEAVTYYEKVYAQNPDDAKTGFQLAWSQYQLKRLDETYRTLMGLKDKKFPENVYVKIPGIKNKIIDVPLKAAYFNLLGLVTYDLHNLDLAVKYFDEALKIYPDFELARQNKAALELMKQKLESSGADKENKEKK